MDLLLLPELLLMASLSLVLAFFLARLISVAADGSTTSSSEDDRPLLHAAAVDRAAAAGSGLEEAEEGQSGGQREEKEPEEEQQQDRSSSATPPLVVDRGLDDARNLHDGARWQEVEIVGGETDEAEQTELSGISSNEVAGVLEQEDHEAEQGEKNGVREIHLISAREADEDEKPRPTRPTDQDEVRTDKQDKPKPTPTGEDGVRTDEQDKPKPTPIEDDVDDVVRTATTTAIAIAVPPPPPGEGPASEEVRPRAEAETEGSAVEVQQVKSVVPEQGGSSSDAADDDDDDWEGIEPSELRKLFAVAASFVASPAGVEAISRLPADVQLQLHGLHKAATEGPCFVAQPMPLKISARAKWHAWQKLGDMNPEVAMEQYITVLSEQVPGWMVEKPNEKSMECEPCDSSEQHQSLVEAERKSEFN